MYACEWGVHFFFLGFFGPGTGQEGDAIQTRAHVFSLFSIYLLYIDWRYVCYHSRARGARIRASWYTLFSLHEYCTPVFCISTALRCVSVLKSARMTQLYLTAMRYYCCCTKEHGIIFVRMYTHAHVLLKFYLLSRLDTGGNQGSRDRMYSISMDLDLVRHTRYNPLRRRKETTEVDA